jgi:D-alanyl-lipoteichoic acid acyltransferase DltB (MBOAT superfamily)
MLLTDILLVGAVFILIRLLPGKELRKWAIFFLSLITIFWFQPLSSIRNLDFWLPFFSLMTALFIWVFIFSWNSFFELKNIIALLVYLTYTVALFLLGIILPSLINELTTIPQFRTLTLIYFTSLMVMALFIHVKITKNIKAFIILFLLLFVFIIQKNNSFALETSRFLRLLNGQTQNLASASEIVWIGYSYLAFRIIHVLKERKRILKMNLSFRDFICYLFYSPTYIAGPIDTVFHFSKGLENTGNNPISEDLLQGGKRIARGLFWKFVVADSLAIISLNETIAAESVKTIWMWVIVFAYAFRIFFDFAGYTEIAIGISRFVGIVLPENFDKPYRAENITIFWNHWHITLTQWFRIYFFNPVTRFLRTRFSNMPTWLIIFLTQSATMILIGMWHGINLNYLIWGIWNAAGLFFHNRLTQITSKPPDLMKETNVKTKLIKVFFTSITFLYISLGWIWFALPDANLSMSVFRTLAGLRVK